MNEKFEKIWDILDSLGEKEGITILYALNPVVELSKILFPSLS